MIILRSLIKKTLSTCFMPMPLRECLRLMLSQVMFTTALTGLNIKPRVLKTMKLRGELQARCIGPGPDLPIPERHSTPTIL